MDKEVTGDGYYKVWPSEMEEMVGYSLETMRLKARNLQMKGYVRLSCTCGKPSETLQTEKTVWVETECVACLERPATRVFQRGHQCYCDQCWKDARAKAGLTGKRSHKAKIPCPMCRDTSVCKPGMAKLKDE